MDETPQFESSRPKSHTRHTSVTTIADNVKNDDTASLSSKGSNSSSASLVSIQVKPATDDTPLLDKNANEIEKVPDQKTYPKETPQSKVRYYQPNVPVDAKPRPLTHSYVYFSGPPPRYRDYKYKDYKAKNTDIPKYKPYKYREYNKYTEYKLTHWNTFWLGGYKAKVKKPVQKKPKPARRPKKPPKKIGILSAHSLFYPYREFKFRPYEKWKDYKYKDYSGYKEYKGRQVPLSTLYNFIGIWRPFGSKPPIPWRKSKTFDPPSRVLVPPAEKYYDPPSRYISESTTEISQNDAVSKLYNPPQRNVEPPATVLPLEESMDTGSIEEFKFHDPPQRSTVEMSADEPSYVPETKVFEPPQKIFIVPASVPSQVIQEEVIPVREEPVAAAIEETRIYDPPSKTITPPRENVEENKEHDPPIRKISAPREYVEETKEFDPQQRELAAPKEYVEEEKLYEPPSSEVRPPREYNEETKILDLPWKQMEPPAEDNVATSPVIVPQVIEPQVFAQNPPESNAEYEPEEKIFNPEERILPINKPDDVPIYEEESKTYDPIEKSLPLPVSVQTPLDPMYSEESKTLDQPERQQFPPVDESAPVSSSPVETVQNLSNEPVRDEPEVPIEETKSYSPPTAHKTPPPTKKPVIIAKIQQPVNSPAPVVTEPAVAASGYPQERVSPSPEMPLEEDYVEETREFSPMAKEIREKSPVPQSQTPQILASISPQQLDEDASPLIRNTPAISASVNPPEKSRSPSPDEPKEAWQPAPQVPKVSSPVLSEKSHETPRPISEPASESSIVNEGNGQGPEPSPLLPEKAPTPEPSAAPSVSQAKKIPALQPAKPESPVASVATPVAAASSGNRVEPPTSPYNGASPRAEVVEKRDRKPEMSVGAQPGIQTQSMVPPSINKRGAAGSIIRTLRLLGK